MSKTSQRHRQYRYSRRERNGYRKEADTETDSEERRGDRPRSNQKHYKDRHKKQAQQKREKTADSDSSISQLL